MSRVTDTLKAERRALATELQKLRDQRQERKRLLDEVDTQILDVRTQLEELDADIAALPERLRPA